MKIEFWPTHHSKRNVEVSKKWDQKTPIEIANAFSQEGLPSMVTYVLTEQENNIEISENQKRNLIAESFFKCASFSEKPLVSKPRPIESVNHLAKHYRHLGYRFLDQKIPFEQLLQECKLPKKR